MIYSDEIKREALRLYYREGLGARRICKRLGIRCPASVRYWVINYSVFGESSFDRRKKRCTVTFPTANEFYRYCQELDQENKRLRSENTFLSRALDIQRPNKKYELINEWSSESVVKLCMLGNVSKSGFYKWKASQDRKEKARKYDDLLSAIREIYDASGGTYGYRRIDKALRKRGIIVNHKRLQHILRENNLQSKLYVVRKNKWTDQSEKKNILRQDFFADKPNEKWTTDITYFHIASKMYYLMCIMDLYDGSIIRHEILPTMEARSAVACVKAAILDRQPGEGLILHSDQGAQFRNREYASFLKEHGIIQSMSRAGNCFDNARIESFFGHLKAELPLMYSCSTFEEFCEALDRYISFYNKTRIKS